jgi:large subunit ribosomal protein L24
MADGQAEAVELRVDDATKYCGVPLKEIKLKKNVLLAAITHGTRTEIPAGDSYFQKGDTVVVIAGKDNKAEGKVLSVDAKNGKVVVEGVNMQTKHAKATQKTAAEIKHMEGPIDVSNVMLFDGKDATRVGYKIENGKKVRVSKKTGAVID